MLKWGVRTRNEVKVRVGEVDIRTGLVKGRGASISMYTGNFNFEEICFSHRIFLSQDRTLFLSIMASPRVDVVGVAVVVPCSLLRHSTPAMDREVTRLTGAN